jgi:hypothetical protein
MLSLAHIVRLAIECDAGRSCPPVGFSQAGNLAQDGTCLQHLSVVLAPVFLTRSEVFRKGEVCTVAGTTPIAEADETPTLVVSFVVSKWR